MSQPVDSDELPPGTPFGLYFHADGVVEQGDATEPPPVQAATVVDNTEGELE